MADRGFISSPHERDFALMGAGAAGRKPGKGGELEKLPSLPPLVPHFHTR